MLLYKLVLSLLIRVVDCKQNTQTQHENYIRFTDSSRQKGDNADGQQEVKN